MNVICLIFSGVLLYSAFCTGSTLNNREGDARIWMLIPNDSGFLHLAALKGDPHGPPAEPSPLEEFDPAEEVTFHLYTRSNPEEAVQLYVGNLNNSSYDPSKPTMFIVHGYNSNAFSSGNIAMKNAFLRAVDCNVIGVDWSKPGGGPLYNICRGNVRPTGDYLALFYQFLESSGASMNDMHCAGHSLGAHVCGFSGKAVNGSLGRISGLDPALPLFDFEVPEERLADTDAIYVDVIHTCGGFLAFQKPIGHADYYPNDGTMVQPGCQPDISGSCSHSRSHVYFVESIESTNFIARQCDSYGEYQNGQCFNNEISPMGYPSPNSSRGSFFLSTASEPPFALG